MSLTEKDAGVKINTVVQEDYAGEPVIVSNGYVKVGDLKVTPQTCERAEVVRNDIDSDEALKTKRGFLAKTVATVLFPPALVVTAKSGIKDFHSLGELINLYWRDGKKSQVFVDHSIAKKIKKVFF